MIPFVDLKQQYTHHRETFLKAMDDVCSTAGYILGPAVDRFEERFAQWLGVEHAVGVNSGTSALALACIALDIGPGDEVLLPANTFIATAIAVHEAGARPVPVDVDPETYLLDLGAAEKVLSPHTKAIIPVHLYGCACDMDALTAFAEAHRLTVIEDACQAHGARWNGHCAGTFGAMGCFSFYPAKNLGAFGDGGMAVTNDPGLAGKLRLRRNYGSTRRYEHEVAGTNSRLDAIQAAVLDAKLDHVTQWNAQRFEAARRYNNHFDGLKGVQAPVLFEHMPGRHVLHLYVIQCEDRAGLQARLLDAEIQSGIHYPVPIHLHQAFAFLNMPAGSCPVAEAAASKILSLPMFPEITATQVDAVAAVIKEHYG